jgi:hypothetical protein
MSNSGASKGAFSAGSSLTCAGELQVREPLLGGYVGAKKRSRTKPTWFSTWPFSEVVREVGIDDFLVALVQQCSHLDHRLLGVAPGTKGEISTMSVKPLARSLVSPPRDVNEEAANAGDLGIGYVRGRRLLGRQINIPCVYFEQPG